VTAFVDYRELGARYDAARTRLLIATACEALGDHKTSREMAQQLVVSEKTVASHLSHIFTKLGVSTRSAATAYAYDHGLV
jgi:hypothetical protein